MQAYADERVAPLLTTARPGILRGLQVDLPPRRLEVAGVIGEGFVVRPGLAVSGDGSPLGLFDEVRATWRALLESWLRENNTDQGGLPSCTAPAYGPGGCGSGYRPLPSYRVGSPQGHPSGDPRHPGLAASGTGPGQHCRHARRAGPEPSGRNQLGSITSSATTSSPPPNGAPSTYRGPCRHLSCPATSIPVW